MALKIKKNPDKDFYHKITKAVMDNDYYCPCSLKKDKDTKCLCKAFREQKAEGYCHCKRFYKVEENA